MANKRDLKKELNFITNELYSECLFIQFYEKEVDEQQADALLDTRRVRQPYQPYRRKRKSETG